MRAQIFLPRAELPYYPWPRIPSPILLRYIFVFAITLNDLSASAHSHQDDQRGHAELITEDVPSTPITRKYAQSLLRADRGLIPLFLDEEQLRGICVLTTCSEGQLLYALDQHRKYAQKVRESREKLVLALTPAAMTILSVKQNGTEFDSELLLALVEEINKNILPIRRTLTVELDHLFLSIRSILDESQYPCFQTAIQGWRRVVMLNARVSGFRDEDLIYHVDLIAMAGDFADDMTELFPEAGSRLLEFTEFCGEHPDPLAQAFLNYRTELDRILASTFWLKWQDHHHARLTSLTGDEKKHARLLNKRIDRWYRIYSLLDRHARLIGSLLGSDELSQIWIERFHASYFPRTHLKNSTDYLYQWLESLETLSPDQLSAIDIIYHDFQDRRSPIRRAMRTATLQMIRQEKILPPTLVMRRVTNDLDPALLHAQSILSELVASANNRMRVLLNRDQQSSFDRHLAQMMIAGRDGRDITY